MKTPRLKTVSKAKGWCLADSDTDARYEIQRIDRPETLKGLPLSPAFKDDTEAIQYVMRQAKSGVVVAIDALVKSSDDILVQRAFWRDTL